MHPGIAGQLRSLRDRNLNNIGEVIAGQSEFDSAFCERYYREHLRFSFGENEKKGLRAFQALCEKHQILPSQQLRLNLA